MRPIKLYLSPEHLFIYRKTNTFAYILIFFLTLIYQNKVTRLCLDEIHLVLDKKINYHILIHVVLSSIPI